ncbi:hypothetical protein D9758_007623 [Tetrapyrgos nigripes]|uniref:F-box domain-containing protein n=1 Tax=Tetrapyrgos nigripes TaxID=182062 RepID=A0A8H5G7X9_9AGAR|nr:hypothetical protein D9758_007623 [Tetrapyrgos nigripes]
MTSISMMEDSKTLSSSNFLPLELVQLIVSHFDADRKALFSLSLVSSTWRSATVPHLFSEVSIWDPSDFIHLKNLIDLSPEIATHCVRSVIYEPGMSILGRGIANLSVDASFGLNKPSSSSSSIAAEATTLGIKPWDPPVPLPPMPKVTSLKWAPDKRQAVHVTPALHQHLENFPSLENLTLNAQFENLREFSVFTSLCNRAPLKKLVLNGTYLSTQKRKQRLKRSLDALVQALPSEQDTPKEDPEPTATQIPDLTSLETLLIDQCEFGCDWVIGFLLSSSKLSGPLHLRSFSLRGTSISTKSLTEILEATASTLEELTLDPLSSGGYYAQGTLIPSIPRLPHLQILTLGQIKLESGGLNPRPLLTWCSHLVSSLYDNSLVPSLQTIHFTFTLDPRERIFDWDNWPIEVTSLMRVADEVKVKVLFDIPDTMEGWEVEALKRLTQNRFPNLENVQVVHEIW